MTPERRILIKEVNWLGDMVMSLPAIATIREARQAAHLAVLVKRELSGFFDGISWIDEVIPYQIRRGTHGIRDRFELLRRLHKRSFDTAVLLPRSFESALWMALARIPRRIGVAAEGRRWLLTRPLQVDMKDPMRHQALAWLEIAKKGFETTGSITKIGLAAAPSHLESMRQWLAAHRQGSGPLIALAPVAAYGPAKEWPAESYATLIDRLATSRIESVLVGGPSERDRCEALARRCRNTPLVSAGQTGIGELIALLSLCDGFAGNDSGAMHLAGALGIPTVAIFGSTNPTRTGPLGPRTCVLYDPPACSPCLQRTCRYGHYECLTRITPAAVAAALEALLTRSGTGHSPASIVPSR